MDRNDLAVIAGRLNIVERSAEGRGRSRHAERFVYAAYPSLDVRHAIYRIYDSYTEQQARDAADRCAGEGR